MRPFQEEEKPPEGFDLRVSFRDEKTGLVVQNNPYVMKVFATPDGGKSRVFERPVGSGNMWDKKGKPAGRWVIDEKTKRGSLDASAAHIAFVPPETSDQKLARALTAKDAEIATLQKELAAIEAQNKAKNKKPEQGS